jgi:hypothetical protein
MVTEAALPGPCDIFHEPLECCTLPPRNVNHPQSKSPALTGYEAGWFEIGVRTRSPQRPADKIRGVLVERPV